MTPNVVFRCHYYTKKSKEYAFYSSQKSNSDYLNYIDKGIRDGHPIDYLAYSGNPEKSSGLFGPSGLLSFREKAKVRKKLRATDSQIWDCVISFEESFGKEHMKSYLDAKNLLKDELPHFLKSNGMDIANVTWVAGLHENTGNRHIHLCFFENKPRRIVANKKEKQYHNGSLKQVSIDDFKVRIEQRLTGAKFSIFSERDEILAKADSYFDSEIDSRSLFDRRFRESLEPLYQKLPDVCTVKELSSFLRATAKKIYRLTEEGTIKSLKVGRTTLFLKSDILEMIGAKGEEIAKEPAKSYGVEESDDGVLVYTSHEANILPHGDYSEKMELQQ